MNSYNLWSQNHNSKEFLYRPGHRQEIAMDDCTMEYPAADYRYVTAPHHVTVPHHEPYAHHHHPMDVTPSNTVPFQPSYHEPLPQWHPADAHSPHSRAMDCSYPNQPSNYGEHDPSDETTPTQTSFSSYPFEQSTTKGSFRPRTTTTVTVTGRAQKKSWGTPPSHNTHAGLSRLPWGQPCQLGFEENIWKEWNWGWTTNPCDYKNIKRDADVGPSPMDNSGHAHNYPAARW